jgi:Flp pilus assembly protein TadD
LSEDFAAVQLIRLIHIRSALRRKDFAAAAAHFEEALAVNPLNPDAWFSQGYAYLKLGEQRKALRVCVYASGYTFKAWE